MTQLTKPSAGAFRAASAIFAYMLPKDQLDDKVCYYLAEIIDRETSVEELLGAAKDTLKGAEGSEYSMVNSTLHLTRLRYAIAKCERSE